MGMVLGVVREEMPQFAVRYQGSGYEVRKYAPSIVVECPFDKGWGASGDGSPFGALARYIGVFGKPQNMKQERNGAERIAMTAPVLVTPAAPSPEPIAMTAPVLVTPHEDSSGTDWMSFVLPASKYKNIEEVPKPTDPRLRLRQLPERLQAVRVFSWNFGASAADRQRKLLLADLARDGWVPKRRTDGEVQWAAAGYNPPFALPFMKRNEILVDVEDKDADTPEPGSAQ